MDESRVLTSNGLSFEFRPPDLARWKDSDDVKYSFLLLDVNLDDVSNDGDDPSKRELQLELQIKFKRVNLCERDKEEPRYYLGLTGAEAGITTQSDCEFYNYTQPSSIDVQYRGRAGGGRTLTFNLQPKVGIGAGDVKAEAEVGGVSAEGKKDAEQALSFADTEHPIQVNHIEGNRVRWTIDTPKSKKAVRDYRMGDLNLSAIMAGQKFIGRCFVKPTRVRYYTQDHEEISGLKESFVRYFVWKAGINIRHRDGYTMTYAEIADDGES